MSLALLLAAAVLVVDVLRRRRVPRPVDPYARALALAREAEHRPPADRRRALALLGRLAGDRETAAAAWSAPDPTPERLAAIVDRLERNGDGA
jgi:hypothetical protein